MTQPTISLLDRVRGVDVKRRVDEAMDALDSVDVVVAKIHKAAEKIKKRGER